MDDLSKEEIIKIGNQIGVEVAHKKMNVREESKDTYNPHRIKHSIILLKKYFAGETEDLELEKHIDKTLEVIKQNEKYYEILELYYSKQWHPEHISKKLNISEKRVSAVAEHVLILFAIGLFGVEMIFFKRSKNIVD